MTHKPASAPCRTPHPAPLDDLQAADPIGVMTATHRRMEGVCERLSRISDDLWHRGREENARRSLVFLEDELPIHLEDEKLSLLPRLRWRMSGTLIADALIANIEERLRHDHEMTRQLVARVVDGLSAVSIGGAPEHPAFFAVELIRLELHLRQHITWQDIFVLPLALEHLTAADMERMGQEIAARHRGCRGPLTPQRKESRP